VLLRELVAAPLLEDAGASGVDVALAGGGRLVLRSPHADHERDARSDLAQLRQDFGGREEAVVHRVVPHLRRRADVDAVEAFTVVLDPLRQGLVFALLAEVEKLLGVDERINAPRPLVVL